MPPSQLLDDVVGRVHQLLIETETRSGPPHESAIREHVLAIAPLLSEEEAAAAAERVSKLLYGLGPLEPLLSDPSVTEIMVNGPDRVWIERQGQLRRVESGLDADRLRIVIERILRPLGLRADRTAPFVDARLPDGSRVNVAVPPLAIDGPYVTIRRFREQPHGLEEFCPSRVAQLLVDAVHRRDSVIVSGGTGAGKTSLLNALAAHLPPSERIITIEDAAELRMPGDHVVRLETRPANAEGVGEVSIRSLVRNALRMRPDRLVIGEVRGAEALDLIQAMNTGHDGSLSTCHANSPVDALDRIEAMALMADVALPAAIVRQHLRSAVDLVVHVARGVEGERRVVAICRSAPHSIEWLLGSEMAESEGGEDA